MKIIWLLGALLMLPASAWAQPELVLVPTNGLPFPVVAPAEVEALATNLPFALHLYEVTLADALDELQKQSGLPLNFGSDRKSPPLNMELSIDLETRSFNEALEAILDEANVSAYLRRFGSYKPWELVFGESEEYEGTLASRQGLFGFRLIGLGSTASKSVDFRNGKATPLKQDARLKIEMALTPELRLPLLGAPQLRVTRAEDETGRSLVLPQRDKPTSGLYYSEEGWGKERATLLLDAPATGARRLAVLEGVAVYVAVAKREKWEIADLLSAPEWTREFSNGEQVFRVTFRAALLTDRSLSFSAEVTEASSTGDAEPDDVFHPLLESDQIFAALRIEDTNGALQRRHSSSSIGQGATTTQTAFFSATASFDGNKPGLPLTTPLKLSFDAPLKLVQTEVPFSFKNLPLP